MEGKKDNTTPISWWKTPRLTREEAKYIESLRQIFRVKDAAKRWIPYNLMPHQMDFHKDDIALKGALAKSRCVVKSRNTSFTTSVCISNLMAVPYYPNQIVPFVRLNEKRAYDLIDEIKDLIRNMKPLNIDGLQYPFNPEDVNMDAAGKIVFPNKVKFEAYPANAIAAENIRGLRISGSAGVLDECFLGNTRIHTKYKRKEIESIQPGEEVLSYNEITKKFEYKKINAVIKRIKKKRKIICLKFNRPGYPIKCTEEHPFYNENFEIVEAKDLKIGDYLISKSERGNKSYTKIQKEIIYGTMMGDAFIDFKNKNNGSRITFTHGLPQREYLEHLQEVLDLNPIKIVQHIRYIEGRKLEYPSVQTESKKSNELLDIRKEFYQDNKKVITENILNKLTPVSLAYWFMDDGTRNHNCYALCTQGFSYNEHLIIQKWFKEKYNIICKIKSAKTQYIITFDSKNSSKLNKLFSQYIIPSMRYKLSKTVRFSEKKYNIEDYKPLSVDKYDYKKVRINDIKVMEINDNVYNLEIEDNHNFLIGDSKILVHNCNFMDNFKAIYTSERDAASGYTSDGEKHFQQNAGTTLRGTATQFAMWFKNLEEMVQRDPESTDFKIYKWQVFDPALFDKEKNPLSQPELIPIVPWHLMHDLNRKYLEDLNTFLEEYMAVAVDAEDVFYPMELYEKQVDKKLVSNNTTTKHSEFFMGVDVASVLDFFVISIFENIPEERIKTSYERDENGDMVKKEESELVDVFYQRYLYYDRGKDLSFMEDKLSEVIGNWAPFGLKRVRIDSGGPGLQLYQNIRKKFNKTYANLVEYVPLGTIKVGNESKKAKEVVHNNQKQLMIYDRVKYLDDDMQRMHFSMWNYKFECERTKEYGHGDTTVANAYALLPINFQGRRQYGDIIMAREDKQEEALTTKELVQNYQKMSWKDKKKMFNKHY